MRLNKLFPGSRESGGHQIGHGGFLQYSPDSGLSLLQNLAQDSPARMAGVPAREPGGGSGWKGDRPLESFDHLPQRDLTGGARQEEAAPETAPGADQAAANQLLENLGKESFRNRRGPGNFAQDGGALFPFPRQEGHSLDPVLDRAIEPQRLPLPCTIPVALKGGPNSSNPKKR